MGPIMKTAVMVDQEPPAPAAKNALLHLLRLRATCKNAGLHSGKRVTADKWLMAGGHP